MSQHLNRLNAKEAAEWDIAYKRFCETGKWEDEEDEYENHTRNDSQRCPNRNGRW